MDREDNHGRFSEVGGYSRKYRWDDIQKIELKSWKKVLEKSNQKLKGKVKKKSIAIRKWENISENWRNSRENWRNSRIVEQQRKLEEQQKNSRRIVEQQNSRIEKIGENWRVEKIRENWRKLEKNSRVGCRSGLGTTITTLVKTIVNLGFRDSSTSFLLFNSNKKREVSLPLFYLSPLKNLATTSSSLLLLMETETGIS